MAGEYAFVMKDLRKVVPPKREILRGIWLSFFHGAKIGVLGANGAGKSSLLRIMAGVDRDFLGAGAGSVLAGLFGAFPVDASPPRTGIVSETGGRTQLSSLFAAAIVLAAGDKARELRKNPAWITGIEHRIETPVLGARDLTTSPSTEASAKAATGGDTGSIEVAEIYAPFTHQQLILTEAIGLPSSTKVNPSGGTLAANPMFCAGLERIGFAAQHIFSRSAGRVLAHATSGPVLQQNLVAVLEGN